MHDKHDEAPRFVDPVKNVAVLESIAPMTLITNFSAVDPTPTRKTVASAIRSTATPKAPTSSTSTS